MTPKRADRRANELESFMTIDNLFNAFIDKIYK